MTKSCDNILHKLVTDAPITFRMPISFVRCSATKEANANNPRQEIKMASTAKKVDNVPRRFSLPNFCAYSSSTKEGENGEAGFIFLNTVSILLSASFTFVLGLILMINTFCASVDRWNIDGRTG